jgi:hypothetical protein
VATRGAGAAAGDANDRGAQPSSSSGRAHLVTALRRGVREGGLIEGQTVAIEYRWGEEPSVSISSDLKTNN